MILQSKLNFESMKIVKDIIRNPYAWPGGYERVSITSDGGVLCHMCLKECYDTVTHSTLHSINDGFQVVAQLISDSIDESLPCDHCNRNLCPYGD